MRMLLLNYEYPPLGGGGGFSSQKIAQELCRKYNDEVTVLTSGIGTEETIETDNYGVKIIRIPVSRNRPHRSSATFAFMLGYVIKSILYVWKHRKHLKGNIDVIYTHFAIPTGPSGVIAQRILGKPNVLQLHGGEILRQPLELEGYKNPLINFAVKYIINDADFVTANSNDTANKTRELLKISRQLEVITLGYSPPDEPLLSQTKLLEKPGDGIVSFVMVSRLVERKGLDYLLQAFANLENPKTELHLVGDGPETDTLLEMSGKLNIRDRVFFHGFVSEEKKFEILCQSDVFVLPTLHEGLGLVYYEAMYCGLPIITTNNGGQTDFLTDQNALLVPIKDVDSLTAALKFSIESREWRINCGKMNKTKIESLYVKNIIHEYSDVFQKVVVK